MPLFSIGALTVLCGWTLLLNTVFLRFDICPAWGLRAYNRVLAPAAVMTILTASFG